MPHRHLLRVCLDKGQRQLHNTLLSESRDLFVRVASSPPVIVGFYRGISITVLGLGAYITGDCYCNDMFCEC